MGKSTPAKKTTKKTPSKKLPAKKRPAPKPVKKAPARPTKSKKPSRPTPVVKKPTSSHAEPAAKKPAKTEAAPKAAASKAKAPATVEKPAAKKSAHAKQPAPAKVAPAAAAKAPPAPKAEEPKSARTPKTTETPRSAQDELRRQLINKARGRSKIQRVVTFTLDDVRGELANRSEPRPDAAETTEAPAAAAPAPTNNVAAARPVAVPEKIENRRFEAASLADILGYNPAANERPEDEEASIDKRFHRYYKILVQLRDDVKSGLEIHTEDTLKRSSREDSGDLSGYGQHMADAGTDNFDRDFALSLVSNEQEALYEIEEAIKRIKAGTYGTCELTGRPISKERLMAVPFARYSVESQTEIERVKRRTSHRGALFGDAGGEEGSKFLEDDSE